MNMERIVIPMRAQGDIKRLDLVAYVGEGIQMSDPVMPLVEKTLSVLDEHFVGVADTDRYLDEFGVYVVDVLIQGVL